MFLNKYFLKGAIAFITVIFISACSDASNENKIITNKTSKINSEVIALDVYKSPTCGCCSSWIEHANNNHFKAVGHNISDLSAFKQEKGIAPQYQSCHTAVSEKGFVFEGHVPTKFIKRFLTEKPKNAIGLAVPGMPAGSPGMEMGNQFSPYQVLLLMKDGSSHVYATINSIEDQS